ncbi:MAG: hypothetical protein QOG67_1224 [Verrucomicrobiota bacterium]
MTRIESPCIAAVRVPSRADIAPVTEVCRVQAQSRDHGEGVSAPRINRDPTATSALAIAQQITRGQWLIEGASMMQCIRHGAGAVVARIVKRSVSATPMIRLMADRVHRPDRGFHVRGSIRWRVGDTVSQHRATSGHGGVRAVGADFWRRFDFFV